LEESNEIVQKERRKQVKIVRPDLTTHDFARILPRKIQQDKERLYSEALQLKQVLNELSEENTRLKTKVSILEREKEKMSKFVASSDGIGKVSRINAYQTRNSEVHLQ
jgi:SpoVK/Ycf46/Vps4 family AAA+-type ATPase